MVFNWTSSSDRHRLMTSGGGPSRRPSRLVTTLVVGSLIKRVTLQNNVISASGIKRGDENAVREELEQIVERTNTDADRRRQATIDEAETKKQAHDQGLIDAEEMTRLFRTKN